MIDKVSNLIKQAEQGYVVEEDTYGKPDMNESLLKVGNLGIIILSQILSDYREYLNTGESYGAFAFGIFLEKTCGFDFTEILIATENEIKLKTGVLDLLVFKNIITEKCNKTSDKEDEYLNLLNLCLFLGGIVENFYYLIVLNSIGGLND